MNTVEPIKNKDDISKIINYLTENHYVMSVIFQVGIYSGLRVSDILGLRIQDVENKDYIVVKEQKTGKYKRFPIKDNLKSVLKEYLEQRKPYKKNEYLFVGARGKKCCRSVVYRNLNTACEKCGVVGIFGTHTMRKTFGYHHYKQFNDLTLLQKIFNHSSPSVTLRYIGITQENIDQSYSDFKYDYDDIQAELTERADFKRRSSYAEIENALEYMLTMYKKLDAKMNKMIKYFEI